MKKLLMLVILALTYAMTLTAQSDCMFLFPNNEGAVLINSRYNAQGKLLNTIVYRILHSYGDIDDGDQDMQIGFVINDSLGQAIDNGVIAARCDDGTFYMDMRNNVMTDSVMSLLSKDTELVGDFLDYPDVFSEMDNPLNDGDPFDMDGGQFTIRSKTNKNDLAKTEVRNRQYVKNEKITTPAGTFLAAKVTFNIEITKNKKTTLYNGIEWYAVNAGIVRSETYDVKGNLLSYTLLTTLKNK